MHIRILSLAAVIACGGTPGAQPHDMSAAGHESAASEHDQVAQTHAAQFDASAGVASDRCSHTRADNSSEICWTSIRNPTAAHLEEAERHRKMAADHRAASKALRDAEASACVGITDEDRDMSPFHRKEDIARVEPLTITIGPPKAQTTRTAGATITFRAVPGMTAQWLQRIVDCHLARNAALGHVVPEMPYCPLVPNGVSAKVSATDNGFAVAVRSDDNATSVEILKRAQALASK